MRVIDRRHQALGGQGNDRAIAQITHIVIHHSANTTNLANVRTTNFENGWRNNSAMGAPNNARGGYHEVVLLNGDVEVNYNDRRIVWGAAGQNGYTWHICVVGQHGAGVNNVTATQLRSLERRIADACRRLGITNMNRIVTHNQLPGQSTACTSVNVANVRTAVSRVLNPSASSPQATQPASTARTRTVRNGETLSGIAQQHRTTVAELVRLNNLPNANVIRVGQVLRLPAGAAVSNTTAGRQLSLNNVRLFANSATSTYTRRSGAFWIWSSEVVNNRIRITNARNRAGVAGQVTGWVRVSDI